MKASVEKWLKEQFGDDGAIIGEVWTEYLKSFGEKLSEAEVSLGGGDYPQLDRIAHTLKGNALMVGDQEAATAAIALRDASKASDGEGCALAIRNLQAIDDANRES